ncbi:MAG: aminotransferase class I/II-fold pyridoxal phosphate-dependent enzyme [Pirellulaceae bacterium]
MSHNEPLPWDDDLERQAVHSPEWLGEDNRPQAEAISVASVWQMDSPETADDALAGKSGAYAYRRDGHPNERALAAKLAKMHAAERAILTAQGMSAIAAVALAVLRPGTTAWIGSELYGKSTKLFVNDLKSWGVVARTFDASDLQAVNALREGPADLVLIETMSNPRLRVPDIAAVANATHHAKGLLVVDNTFATHLLCQPLTLGADLVVESLGKQVNGHSDSMLGLVAVKDGGLASRIADIVSTFGMASSPLDCYLTHRGLMSLGLRVERACRNAAALAEALENVDTVSSVDYPGLHSHLQHELATQQLRGGYGWMLSFTLPIERGDVLKLFDCLRPDIPFVPSLGDINTTVSHPATTSHRGLTAAQRQLLGIEEGTIRVSCGAEPTQWLVDRFTTAIRHAFAST